MNRSQRRKMLSDAGLLGRQAEKKGIKIDKRELNSIVKSGEEKRRSDLQRIKNERIFQGKEEKNNSQEYIEFVNPPSGSYNGLENLFNNPNWEEIKD
jgi:hypothetical protein